MIENRYQPGTVEPRVYQAWEQAGAFRAGRPERAAAEPYCIVIPPPNVTGSLHMGHALNNTLQDILARFERMRGKDVLWQPGTDHAGIATQAVVERQLAERKLPNSREMGREAFIKRVWEWKAESGGAIINQLKRLGASCDWSRERFTMDEGLSRAVMKVFVTLYREGLIYKDKRLVNWDPKLKTAISDLEVQQVETRGSLWYIKYPIENSDEFIVVATTRPETMLGDVAVAVHPDNERLKHLIGKHAILPLVRRRIPIIADDYADPEKGSGAVKITPAHDFNDFEVWQRHKDAELARYEPINIFDREANLLLQGNEAFLNGAHPQIGLIPLNGVNRDRARGVIVEMLESQGFIDKIESTSHVVPHGDRSGAVLEPFLTDQWYVDAKTLAQPAIAAVREGRTQFIPQQWEATFFNWMDNIQPWCISRQIWWGHQIPAWYGPDGEIFVAETEAEAEIQARAYYAKTRPVAQQKARRRNRRSQYTGSNWRSAIKRLRELGLTGNRKIDLRKRKPNKRVVDLINKFSAVLERTASVVEVPSAIARALKADYLVVGNKVVIPRKKGERLRYNAKVGAIVGTRRIRSKRIRRFIRAKPKKRENITLKRDQDVLDTWFSSALWPFSTLGWPDQTPELKRFYPTSALVTGFDIIFFWVARMMMMGLHFMQKERPGAPLEQVVPFRDVYIHRLVRDAAGAKMSKSKGNVVDPLGVIDQYGADALRFTLARGAAQGHDIRLGPQDVENNRNFATKLWNAARFGEINGCARDRDFDPRRAKQTLNRWIAHETAKATREVTAAIETYKFNDAAAAAYRFVWNIYCDWYLELIKPVLIGPDGDAKNETRAVAAWVLDEILKLLHPFMPFVTEELWRVTAEQGVKRDQLLALDTWPQHDGLDAPDAEAEIGWVIDLITAIRSVRAEMNITAQIPLVLVAAPAETNKRVERWAEFIKRLARVSDISTANAAPAGSLQLVVRGEVAALPLKGVIDLAAERARLEKEMAKADADIARVDAKLNNANFVARAPEEVVEEEKAKREEALARKAKIAEALARLKGAA